MISDNRFHWGLDVAEYIASVDPKAKRIDLLLQESKRAISGFQIEPGSANYQVLLLGADAFGVTDLEERQIYFRFIFLECLAIEKNKNGEVTS